MAWRLVFLPHFSYHSLIVLIHQLWSTTQHNHHWIDDGWIRFYCRALALARFGTDFISFRQELFSSICLGWVGPVWLDEGLTLLRLALRLRWERKGKKSLNKKHRLDRIWSTGLDWTVMPRTTTSVSFSLTDWSITCLPCCVCVFWDIPHCTFEFFHVSFVFVFCVFDPPVMSFSLHLSI